MSTLAILALPAGVISGNFSDVWAKYESNLKEEAKLSLEDKRFITAAIQRIDPYTLSQKLLIEIWHERSLVQKDEKAKEGVASRPDAPEFMGEAYLDLGLEG